MKFFTIALVLLVSSSPLLVLTLPIGSSSSGSDETLGSIEFDEKQETQPRLSLQKRSVSGQTENTENATNIQVLDIEIQSANEQTTQSANQTLGQFKGKRIHIKLKKIIN